VSLQGQRHIDSCCHDKWRDSTCNAYVEIVLREYALVVCEEVVELLPMAREVDSLEDSSDNAKDQGEEVENMYQLAPLRFSSQE
jgi:hypothetical protein